MLSENRIREAMATSSEFSGFYTLSPAERLAKIAQACNLTPEEQELLQKEGSLALAVADKMAENVIGFMPLPLGIATNFKINGTDYLIPMAIEEPSVIAAASNAAKITRQCGGFSASVSNPIMRGQVQLVGIADAKEARKKLLEKKKDIKKAAKDATKGMAEYGGGFRKFSCRAIKTPRGEMLIAEFFIDVRDAMGANTVNTALESLAPMLSEISGGKARLRILSNLAIERTAKASAVWKKEILGEETIEGVLDAYEFAANDIFRCATHNKGIMNGVGALAVATGNDWRAIEAGAHAFAAYKKGYKPLTRYRKNENGDLVGEIELPVAVGTVGGATRTHPIAKIALKIAGVKGAGELGMLMASLGLAQNFAALRALSTEGIQKGHMKLHARNIAINAGATAEEADRIAQKMVEEGNISVSRAKELLVK
jgi:hydroxymethylglutaryl-CoA reductase